MRGEALAWRRDSLHLDQRDVVPRMAGIKHSSGSLPSGQDAARLDARDGATELPVPGDGWEGSLQAVNELIVGLYRFGRSVPLDRFQPWALERLREVVDFDSALWRTSGDLPAGKDSIHLYRQTRALIDEYLQEGWHQRDFLRARCAASPGAALRITDVVSAGAWQRMPMYRRFARRYGIEWALSTHHVEPILALRSVVSLWRAERARPFSEEDRRRLQLLTPHLVESMHLNRTWHFAAAVRPTAHGSAMAVCGGDGKLHDCSPGFSQLVRAEWPDWAGTTMPTAVVARLGQGRFEGRRIDIDCQALGDLWLLTLRAGGAAKQLGGREFQAASLYAQGLTYRAIAQRLGVAPSTVRNQLRSSFAKLGVSSKVELARRLGGTG
jgi:DNA-binding CsgD family transcriptional regulator